MSTKREQIEKNAEELLLPVLEAGNYEFVDLEYVKEAGSWYLRAYADKPGGITIDDCEIISKAFEEKLDAANLIEDAYILEVSSPGLGRALKKERDYVRAKGQNIEIRTYRPIDGEKECTGVLTDWTDSTVTVLAGDAPRTFDKKDISLIRMAIEW